MTASYHIYSPTCATMEMSPRWAPITRLLTQPPVPQRCHIHSQATQSWTCCWANTSHITVQSIPSGQFYWAGVCFLPLSPIKLCGRHWERAITGLLGKASHSFPLSPRAQQPGALICGWKVPPILTLDTPSHHLQPHTVHAVELLSSVSSH